MKDELIRPSWSDIHEMCRDIHYHYIEDFNIIPDCIVGVTRGGLIPSTILSHLFDVPLVTVSYTSSTGNGTKAMYANMELNPIDNIPAFADNLTILLIDEISDTGNTLKELVEYYNNLGYQVITGVLHHREGSIHVPDYIATTLTKEDPWVVYPWEIG